MTAKYAGVITAVAAAGCVPLVTTYYEPKAEFGKVINDDRGCGTVMGPPTTIKFLPRRNLDIRITSDESGHLTLLVLVPKDSIVDLASHEAIVRADEETKTYTLGDFILLGLEETETYGYPWTRSHPQIFRTWLLLERSPKETYQVRFPEIVVDGSAVSLPPITFSKSSGLGIYLVNC
jgi:hypothetical protein